MRAIDADNAREELIATLRDCFNVTYEVVDVVATTINNMPTIDAEPHWIPVEQELPETDDEVLTTYIVNGNRKKRYVETSRYYYDGFSGYWSSPWDEYRIAGTRIEVIAWMPLPEFYKGMTE